jgi:hypothetical protein
MVAVLLAAAGVAPARLEMAGRKGADPNVGPGGRDDERADPLQELAVRDARS